ncbi:uncharacterized protein LOC123004070 [Tribolium madens]|uniref:uncharacterized protein LOC123004070 n=1 Tax=Tribolium madens TaxID=41895 RepID=UPI001CF71F7C|nr:uncharacterized protein LOC123004070 [Tribolium madens]
MKWHCFLTFVHIFWCNGVVLDCVNRILENHYHPGDIILVMDSPDLQIPLPSIRQNGTHSVKKFVYQLPKIVVITLTAKIDKHLITLEKIGMLNPRAKFVIISRETGEFSEIFKSLSLYFIYKVVIIDQEREIVTYDPFVGENVNINPEPYILGGCHNYSLAKIFDKKIPKLWRNTTVRAIFAEHFPYLYYENQTLLGENYKVLSMIKEKLEFNLVIKELDERKSWIFLGLLQRRDFHIIGNLQTLQASSHLKVDLVPIDLAAHFYWVVPRGRQVPYWKIFLLDIDSLVWTSIFFVLILLTIIWHYIEGRGLIYSFFTHYQLFSESNSFKVLKIKKISNRIFIASSMFSFLIISTTFKSEMLNSFNTVLYDYPIKSLDDIIAKNLSCYVSQDMKLLYKSVSDFYFKYVSNCDELDDLDDQQDILLKIALEEKSATISRNLKFKFAANTLLQMGYQKPPIFLIRKQVKFDFLYIYLTKGFPLHDRITQVVSRMHSSGFTAYFRRIVDYKIASALKSNEKIQSKNLALENVSMGIYVLYIGLSCSFVAFVVEIILYKHKSSVEIK